MLDDAMLDAMKLDVGYAYADSAQAYSTSQASAIPSSIINASAMSASTSSASAIVNVIVNAVASASSRSFAMAGAIVIPFERAQALVLAMLEQRTVRIEESQRRVIVESESRSILLPADMKVIA